jgi:hypothetical protein
MEGKGIVSGSSSQLLVSIYFNFRCDGVYRPFKLEFGSYYRLHAVAMLWNNGMAGTYSQVWVRGALQASTVISCLRHSLERRSQQHRNFHDVHLSHI